MFREACYRNIHSAYNKNFKMAYTTYIYIDYLPITDRELAAPRVRR